MKTLKINHSITETVEFYVSFTFSITAKSKEEAKAIAKIMAERHRNMDGVLAPYNKVYLGEFEGIKENVYMEKSTLKKLENSQLIK